MIDKKKRDTLKIISTATAVATAPSLLNANTFLGNGDSTSADLNDHVKDYANEHVNNLANIDIKVRVSVTSNDLELLISNTGTSATNITQLTPTHLHAARGYFDMQGLVADGPLSLKPGQGVTVPLIKQADSNLSSVSNSLIKDLRDRVSVVTDTDAFAAVSISRMPYFV